MGIIVSKDEDENTRLQERISSDLRDRTQKKSARGRGHDFVDDAEYMKELKKTSRFSWIWPVLIILAVISLIFIITL